MNSSAPTAGNDLNPMALIPEHLDLYYGGHWHAPKSGRYNETFNPACAEPIARVAEAGNEDAEAAINSAQQAFTTWRELKPTVRADYLKKAASVLEAHAEELAMLDALNTGNPVAEMSNDARFAAGAINYFAGLISETKGETMPMGPDNLNYTTREPLGVVARIVAYNHPLMFSAMKIGAPLAAGNTVVVKPPVQAPLSALRMAELIGDIFPPGVVNVLPGDIECGQALASHRLVRKITLIGSVPTGKAVMRTAADTLKPVLFELGGKNALIAYPDADIEKLIDGAVGGMNFTWAGQSCGSMSRQFLHESIHDQVLEGIIERVRERHRPGVPTLWATTMGPLISQTQFDKVMRYIEWGQEDGARLVTGGKRAEDPELAKGFFVEPTVFADVTPNMRIAKEEIFGPVLSVFKWKDEDELFEAVNSVDYGLTASIWTRDLVTAHRAASRVEAGYVWINNASQHFLGAPFGGHKQSGIGREECFEEMLEFTQMKNVNVNLSE